MGKIYFIFVAALLSSNAFAYQEGTYTCKNAHGIPDNVYKISEVSISASGLSLPFVEATRYFNLKPNDPSSPTEVAHLKGFAAVSQRDNISTLMLGALQIEFEGDKLSGCVRQ